MARLSIHTAARPSRRYRRARRGEPFRHGFTFTLGGAAYIAITFFVGVAAANSQINLLFLVFGILLGGLVVSGFVSTLTLSRLRVVRQMPASAATGESVLLLHDVTNRKRWLASYSLHVREYHAPAVAGETYLPVIRAGETTTQRAAVQCTRRGLYRFEALTVYTRFPFGLFIHFARFKCPDELVVFPALGRLTHDALSLVLRSRGSTLQPQQRRGGEDEFYGLREYRHGDNPHWIHWRRSARLGVLVVREMSPLMPRRLMVLVSARAAAQGDGGDGQDSGPPVFDGRSSAEAGESDELLEQALSLAATAIHGAIGQSFEVGLVLAEPTPHIRQRSWFGPSRGQHHWFEMMRALALFAGRQPVPLTDLPRDCLRQMAGGLCLWITRGLSADEIDQQVRGLAEWNIAVRPLPAEEVDFRRLISFPPPEQPSAEGSTVGGLENSASVSLQMPHRRQPQRRHDGDG